LQPKFPPYDVRRPYKTVDCGASIVRVEQPVKLSAAGMHQFGHALFGQILLLHLFEQKSGNALLGPDPSLYDSDQGEAD
jgi:hypothetical protein